MPNCFNLIADKEISKLKNSGFYPLDISAIPNIPKMLFVPDAKAGDPLRPLLQVF
jgi:hypothetical protein